MILPFSQHFDKQKQKPTYFAEKIWKTIDVHKIVSENECIEYSSKTQFLNLAYSKIETFIPKIHTITSDFKNRWKQGNKIHPVFNNRSKNHFQFAPPFECKGIQSIEIFNLCEVKFVNINNVQLTLTEIERLSINDGFENANDFWDFFKTKVEKTKIISSFKGKIIHFTDFRY
jgi:hypothetical protein